MKTTEERMVEWLALVEMGWQDSGPSRRRKNSEQTIFKGYGVGLVKQLWRRRSVWRYLTGTPRVGEACGLASIPDRRTVDRRLGEIGPEAERQIAALGLVLWLEAVTDGTMAASDGSAFAARGRVWDKADKEAGRVPPGLHGLNPEADWNQST